MSEIAIDEHTHVYEFQFIERLGTCGDLGSSALKIGRRELLKRYICAAEKRYYWGKLNKKQCVAKAKEELAKL